MSRFYVGQRVRFVRFASKCNLFPAVFRRKKIQIGDIFVICGTAAQPNAGFHTYADRDISVQPIGETVFGMAPSYCFEPATDCYDKTTWDKCVWQPNRQEVTL